MTLKVQSPIDMQAQKISNLGSPSVATDAATKSYVDNVVAGLDWKLSVRAASTGTVTLSAPGATLDGVSMVAGDRFLAKDQSTASQNGIYVWNGAAVAATRATDADSSSEVSPGMAVSVEEGTVNGDRTFLLATDAPITLDTTSLTFTTWSAGPSLVGGDGLTFTSGTTFDVGAGTGITVGADSVSIDTNVVARKFAANVGDGSATSITVTHNFGTRDVDVQVYTAATPWETVLCEAQRPDANTVTLIFGTAPAVSQYRAVIRG